MKITTSNPQYYRKNPNQAQDLVIEINPHINALEFLYKNPLGLLVLFITRRRWMGWLAARFSLAELPNEIFKMSFGNRELNFLGRGDHLRSIQDFKPYDSSIVAEVSDNARTNLIAFLDLFVSKSDCH